MRIRYLPIALKVPNQSLNEDDLARLWALEFFRALTIALNTGRSAGGVIVKAETRTEWLARFISDLLSGSAQSQWEYEEFADLSKSGTVETLLTIFQREPEEIIPVLQLLDERRRLDPLLTLFGDFAFERLFTLIAQSQSGKTAELTLDKVLRIGLLARSHSSVNGILATRRRAFDLFLALNRGHLELKLAGLTPRLVFSALMILDVLMDVTQSLPVALWSDQLSPKKLAQRSRPLNPTVLTVIQEFRDLAATGAGETKNEVLSQIVDLIHELTPSTPLPAERRSNSYWLSGDYAGLFLTVGLIDRLRWPARVLETSLGRTWGTQALTCFFAALGLRTFGSSLNVDRLDPTLAVFAGWLTPGSANPGLIHTLLDSCSEQQRPELLHALEVARNEEEVSSDWQTTFDVIADKLVSEFAARVRGFRKASSNFVINAFFHQAGRICVDEKSILVLLPQNAFHIALHISGFDEPVESVNWLGNRRLEFRLEGL